MKLYALGPKGSYGHEAALIAGSDFLLEEDMQLGFASTNIGILQAAEAEADAGAIIPIENSTYGDVVDVLGYLAQQTRDYPLHIVGQVELPVRHSLLVRPEVSDVAEIETILSHPQAIGQCSESVKRWGRKTDVTTSTAAAAKFVAEHPELRVAALASELAAREYGLKPLERNVQTREDNVTRFFVLAPIEMNYPSTGEDKTVLIFTIPHNPGALFEATGVFALRNINITAIHSIPLGGWKYGFYLEIDGHAAETRVHEALHELNGKTLDRWILGSFPKRMSSLLK